MRGAFSSTLNPIGALLAVTLASALLPAASAANGSVWFAGGSPMTVGQTFGAHGELSMAMDPAGESVLAWDLSAGEGHSLQVSALAAGAGEALPASTLASSRRVISAPQLALAANGRAAVAFFEERETEQEWGREALALQIRDRSPGGTWAGARTVWQAAVHSRYVQGSLTVAMDSAGDEALAWLMRRESRSSRAWTVMVATRAADGALSAPTVLARNASEAPPALAVNEAGEVSVLWCAPDEAEQVHASSWPAGGSPASASVVLDEASSAEQKVRPRDFAALALDVGGTGTELATWLKGPHEANRPEPVALRAAWREPRAAFAPSYTVTDPGVEAREPVVSFGPGRDALIVWSELQSDGAGPVLNYASGASGATLLAHGALAVPLAARPQLRAAWVAADSAVLVWRESSGVLVDQWAPGGALSPPKPIGRLSAEFGEPAEELQLAAGGLSPPLLAWIGRSPSDSATEAVRYLPDSELAGSRQPTAPTVELSGSRQFAHVRHVEVGADCPEACQLTATGELFGLRTENAEEAAGSSYLPLGSLVAAHAALAAGEHVVLTLPAPSGTLRAYCRSRRRGAEDAIELRVSVRLANGVERHLALGDSPTGRPCRR